jgi:hypothetical protein
MTRPFAVLLLSLAVLLASSPPAHANTEPVMQSAVHATGNLQPLPKPNIKLAEEVLIIRLDGFHADVDVRYRYYNAGPADTVACAFPLDDFLHVHKEFVVPYPRSLITDSFQGFRITDGTGELATSEKIEDLVPATRPRGYGGVFRRWQIAAVHFPAHSEKTVQVSYRVKNFHYGDGQPSRGQLTTLVYALSPSRYWGDGTVGRFLAIVDARANLRAGTVMKHLSLPFRDDGGLYVYEARNFDLAKAGDLVVEYDETAKFAAAQALRRSKENRQMSVSSVRVSSAHPGEHGVENSIENLFDGDLDTAWQAGAGDWLEIAYKWPGGRSLRLVNGCVAGSEAYGRNGRVKKLRVEIFRAGERIGDHLWDLPDRAYAALRKTTFLDFADVLDLSAYSDLNTNRDPITLRLTVLETYPGTRTDSACLAELLL